MASHAVPLRKVAQHFPLTGHDGPIDLTMHHRRAGDRSQSSTRQPPGDVDVGMGHHVEVDAKAQGIRVQAGVATSAAGDIDPPPMSTEVGTEREQDTVGSAGCSRDHSRPAGSDLYRHVHIGVGQPGQAAASRRVRQSDRLY